MLLFLAGPAGARQARPVSLEEARRLAVARTENGSFLDPIPIMASLPLSLIGVMLALLITGSTINLMSMIGVVLLMGIVAKNAILLIDFAEHAQKQGMDRKQAIAEAGA